MNRVEQIFALLQEPSGVSICASVLVKRVNWVPWSQRWRAWARLPERQSTGRTNARATYARAPRSRRRLRLAPLAAAPSASVFVLLYLCTRKTSKVRSTYGQQRLLRQYSYFCTSKARKMSSLVRTAATLSAVCRSATHEISQYWYCCTSKASKLNST